ncbi:MAG: dihydrodipicolinate synthase family protein, partial [Deltaproteobacteria bacterium]|nr:dihydrodipicolinate synthase family protein [Deltaproteobacteria bacterium]
NVFLSQKEKERVLAAARKAIPPDKVMMVGTGCQSTWQTVEMSRLAAKAGADCALVVSPFYYKGQMRPDRLTAHYYRVADEAPLPVLIYNFPQSTGLNLGPDLVARLAEHPNLVGIKDSSGNIGQLSEILRLTPPEFAVFTGNAPVFYPALCLGARGGILAVANVAPEVCLEILARFEQGDLQAALDLQRLMTPLAEMVTVGQGIGGLKLAMNLAGYQGGGVRGPLTRPQEPEVEAALKAELAKLGLLKG